MVIQTVESEARTNSTPDQLYLPSRERNLAEAVATYWAGFILDKTRQDIFQQHLANAIYDRIYAPQDPRRGKEEKWPIVTTIRIGIGIQHETDFMHPAYNDSALREAIISSGIDPQVLPLETHTTLDTVTGEVILETKEAQTSKKKSIFLIS